MPVLICEDCLFLIANDEATDDHRKAFIDWMDSNYSENVSLVLGDPDNEIPFSNARCEGCGTHLAGNRFEAHVME